MVVLLAGVRFAVVRHVIVRRVVTRWVVVRDTVEWLAVARPDAYKSVNCIKKGSPL